MPTPTPRADRRASAGGGQTAPGREGQGARCAPPVCTARTLRWTGSPRKFATFGVSKSRTVSCPLNAHCDEASGEEATFFQGVPPWTS